MWLFLAEWPKALLLREKINEKPQRSQVRHPAWAIFYYCADVNGEDGAGMRAEAGDRGGGVVEAERGREAAEVADDEGLVFDQLDDGRPRTGDEASQLSPGLGAAKQELVGKPDKIV